MIEENDEHPRIQQGLALYNNMTEVSNFVSERVREMANTINKWMETHRKYQEAKKKIAELERE